MLARDAFGRGPRTVVLLHGWPLDRTIWRDVAQRVARAGFRVLVPDLPGFGSSPGIPEPEATVEAFAESVAEFIRTSSRGPVALVGHSFAGYVGLALMDLRPDLLAGIGLVSSRTIADSEAARRGRSEAIAKVRVQGTAALLPGLVEKLLGPRADARLRKRASKLVARASVDGVLAGLEAMARRPDRTMAFEGFPRPALVVHGTEDALIPLPEAATAPGPRRTIRVLPNVGHMPMWEAPRETADAVVAWAKAALLR